MTLSLRALLALMCIASPLPVIAQPAVIGTIGVASGGDTNDVQLTYGLGADVLQRNRLTIGAEVFYVRDFFEFEPDDALNDALRYSGVTGLAGQARFWLADPARSFLPYLSGSLGLLRASTDEGRSSAHVGLGLGAGIRLFERSRTSLLLDVHRYAAIETDTADGFSFWRTVLAARVRF